MKILFLVPYPLKKSPSQRFRFEQYFDLLAIKGYEYEVKPFMNADDWTVTFESGRIFRKIQITAAGFVRRALLMFALKKFDRIFIHREAAPIGPPVFEWIISRVLRKKIIYDFDDAIWVTDRTNEPSWMTRIKWRKKFGSVCRWSHKISAGNDYLCDNARRFNKNVFLNPTTVETRQTIRQHPDRKSENEKVVVGWTGSHSTLKYLRPLEPVLRSLGKKFPQVTFVIIADRPPAMDLPSLSFINWSAETELADLSQIDIGVMPLPNDEWSKGKCGFKALQYMSVGAPAVVSPVGVNTKIVEDGIEGYHCVTSEDWFEKLEHLVMDRAARHSMGQLGKEKVLKSYSVISNSENFLRFFE